MRYYNDELRRLYNGVLEYRRLSAEAKELAERRETLRQRAGELREIMRREQADVDKLEGRSLAAFFYNVVGKMDEKLTKEREEAYAAAVKWDAAQKELNAVEAALEERRQAAARLKDCEGRYEELKARKREALRAAGGPESDGIIRLEERIACLENQGREIREAVSAGREALGLADAVISGLDSADGWNTWDMFGGGGIVVHMAKHSILDEAQEAVEQLQLALGRFKTELADVNIQADMQVNIDGFLRFADWFFDGLFADLAVRERISSSTEQVEAVRSKVNSALARLEAMAGSVELERRSAQGELDALVVSAGE